jgi:hypothetical protein
MSLTRTPFDTPDIEEPEGRRGAPLPTWGRVLILIVVAGVMAAVVIRNPGAVVGTVRSPQGLAIVSITIAAFVAASMIMVRLGARPAVRLPILAVPALVVFWLWLLPSLQTGTVVDEALPGLEPAVDPAVADTAEATEAPAETAQDGGTATEEEDGDAAEVAPEEPEEVAPAEPVALTSGTFVGLDAHRAEGSALLYELPDGSLIVRLEEVDLQNVPAPVVYIVPGLDATGPTDDLIDLGALKGNLGSANYPVPPDAEIPEEFTVLVWCTTFASPVGAASQAPIQ